MELNQILQRLDASTQASDDSVKTASASPAPSETPDELRQALRQAVSAAPGQTKTAAASEDVGDHLLKMASDMANAEE